MAVGENISRSAAAAKIKSGQSYAAAAAMGAKPPSIDHQATVEMTATDSTSRETMKTTAAPTTSGNPQPNTIQQPKKPKPRPVKEKRSRTDRKLEAMMNLMASFMKVMSEISGNAQLKQIAEEAAVLMSTSNDSESEAEEWETEAEIATHPTTTSSTRRKKKKKKRSVNGAGPNSESSNRIHPTAIANGLNFSAIASGINPSAAANGINPFAFYNGINPSAFANGMHQINVLPSMPSLTEDAR